MSRRVCDCWTLIETVKPPILSSQDWKTARANYKHYIDQKNAEIDEALHPCYVLCGHSYLDKATGATLELAIVEDGQQATCPACIGEYERIKVSGDNMKQVIF